MEATGGSLRHAARPSHSRSKQKLGSGFQQRHTLATKFAVHQENFWKLTNIGMPLILSEFPEHKGQLSLKCPPVSTPQRDQGPEDHHPG
jgi:hypothetical protein